MCVKFIEGWLIRFSNPAARNQSHTQGYRDHVTFSGGQPAISGSVNSATVQ